MADLFPFGECEASMGRGPGVLQQGTTNSDKIMATIKCSVCGGNLELHQLYFIRSFGFAGQVQYDSSCHYECDSCPFASKSGQDPEDAWEKVQELLCIFPGSKKKVDVQVGCFNGVSLNQIPCVVKNPTRRIGFFNLNGTISHWSFEMKG